MGARIQQQLAYIHPFENGNGHFSRLIADRYLLSFKCPYPIWPNHLNQEGKTRKDYIQTLKAADKGDYSLLINLMKALGAKDPNLSELINNNSYEPIRINLCMGFPTIFAPNRRFSLGSY